MSILKEIRSFVLEDDFKLLFQNNKIDIVNYSTIDHFDSNKIIISYSSGSICVKGKNLIISKLLVDELLIEGNIETIEFR